MILYTNYSPEKRESQDMRRVKYQDYFSPSLHLSIGKLLDHMIGARFRSNHVSAGTNHEDDPWPGISRCVINSPTHPLTSHNGHTTNCVNPQKTSQIRGTFF